MDRASKGGKNYNGKVRRIDWERMERNSREYIYINKDGRVKGLIVFHSYKLGNEYLTSIWDMETGERCGSAYKTKEEITAFLNEYGVNPVFDN